MKFIVDEMFGNIARWLRTLGYDTIYAGENKTIDGNHNILEQDLIKESLNNHRILITRDMNEIVSLESQFYKRMEKYPDEYEEFGMAVPEEFGMITPCIFLRDTNLLDGLKRIYDEFRINLIYDAERARCGKCNYKIMKIKKKDDYRDQIPERVYEYQKDYWICTNKDCAQVYWKGTHIISIADKLKKLRTRAI